MDPFSEARQRLIDHLRAQGIRSETVLDAMSKVPRHRFVTAAHLQVAYQDRALALAHGQTISQPFVVAYMTGAAALKPDARILEIGTGSGYQAAVLAQIAKAVYSVEIIPALADSAERLLEALGYDNVRIKSGNGYAGWVEHAPFDAIVVTAAPQQIPQALIDQLAVGGKMVIPVGAGTQDLMSITKTESGLIEKRMIGVRFVPMTGHPEN